MQYYILPTDKDLQHHGVLGMKWGVRRYQPYSVVPRGSGEGGKEIGKAKTYKKIAKENVKIAYKQIKDNVQAYMAVEKKTSKLEKKNSPKAEAYKEKTGIKQAERKQILEEAIDQIDAADLAVGQKAVNKMLNNNEFKNSLIASMALTTVYNIGIGGLTLAGIPTGWAPRVMPVPDLNAIAADNYISKNRGKTPIDYVTVIKGVENNQSNSSSSKSGSSGLSSEQKQSALNRAKNDDKWDLNFLESIQNSEILYKNDTKSMLTEYNKFLDDPEKYWKEDRYKLKEA